MLLFPPQTHPHLHTRAATGPLLHFLLHIQNPLDPLLTGFLQQARKEEAISSKKAGSLHDGGNSKAILDDPLLPLESLCSF